MISQPYPAKNQEQVDPDQPPTTGFSMLADESGQALHEQPTQFNTDDNDDDDAEYVDADSELLPHRDTIKISAVPRYLDLPASSAQDTRQYYVHGIVQGLHAYLITNLPGGESETLLQPQMVWTVGRNRQVAILLRDGGLSRRHAVIQYVKREGFYLIDLNSMNGSFVNGVRIKQRQLLGDGDQIRMANTYFTFYISRRHKTLEAIHPEVLSRLNESGSLSEEQVVS